MVHTKLVHDARSHEIHQIIDRLGQVIEAWRERHDHGPGTGQPIHVGQIDSAQRRFAVGQHQTPAFLQAHRGGPMHQRVGHACGQMAQRVAGTRHDGHAVMKKRP